MPISLLPQGAVPKVRVHVVGNIRLCASGNFSDGEIRPCLAIEEDVPFSAEDDEEIVIHINSPHGMSRATRLLLALFGALKPDVVSLRQAVPVSHARTRTVIPFRSIPGDSDQLVVEVGHSKDPVGCVATPMVVPGGEFGNCLAAEPETAP